MTRIADFAQFQLTMSYISRTQNDVAETQIQIASGKRAQTYSEIPTQTNQLVNLERSVTRTEQFSENIDRALNRLNTMEAAVNVMVERAIEVKSIISQGLSGTNLDDLPLQEFANTFSSEVAALLNTQLGGEYLFAGSLTDQAPVDLNDPLYTPQAGLPGAFTADSNYYQGDDFVQSVRADDNYDLDYGLRADDTAFEELLRTFAYMDYADVNSDKVVLEQAFTLVSSAIDGLSDLRGQIGAHSEVLDDARNSHNDFVTFANNLVSNIEDVDVAEATTNLAFNEVQLQGSYLAISRLRELSLLNFIS